MSIKWPDYLSADDLSNLQELYDSYPSLKALTEAINIRAKLWGRWPITDFSVSRFLKRQGVKLRRRGYVKDQEAKHG